MKSHLFIRRGFAKLRLLTTRNRNLFFHHLNWSPGTKVQDEKSMVFFGQYF